MNIAIALNRNYIPQTCVMLNSVVKNNKSEIKIYVLHSELNCEDEKLLNSVVKAESEKCELKFIYIDNAAFSDLPVNQFWTIEMYYRLLLTDILDETVDRILYLDVDMIVNKDISEFYNMDFNDKLLVVSKDLEFDTVLKQTQVDNKTKRYQLFCDLKQKGMEYFCSGMILFNIKELRKEYCFGKYMDIFYSIMDSVELPDQDLLNYVHWKDVYFVDEMKYGVFAQTAHSMGYSYQYMKDNAYILHYTGQAKPWTVNLVRYDIEKIWWEYAKDTPYYYNMLENVWNNTIASTFVEDKFKELSAENQQVKTLLFKYKEMLEKVMNVK